MNFTQDELILMLETLEENEDEYGGDDSDDEDKEPAVKDTKVECPIWAAQSAGMGAGVPQSKQTGKDDAER